MQKYTEAIISFIIGIFGVNAGKIIGLMLVSMLPIIELRGSIPVGYAMKLPWYVTMFCSILGNLLPVPVILIFVVKVFDFMKKHNILIKFVNKMEEKAMNRSEKVLKGEFWGLMLFVAIPLPGTGAWTGALIAALLKMNKKDAFLSIFLGVLIAGLIMTMGVYGIIGNILR